MKQLVVISGKGGTGKTTVVASLADLARRTHRVVLADCDVDASNLALLCPGTDDRCEPFMAGRRARIGGQECTGCSECSWVCRFEAVRVDGIAQVDQLACEGCGACALVCPVEAIHFVDNQAGWWMERTDGACPLVHARLGVAQDNSGKLVARVRHQARERAEEHSADLLILDGAPGIGCPVHASLTGSDLALVVTEPTPSGEHDLIRTLDLTDHFEMQATVLINKYDLSPDITARIEEESAGRGVPVVGRIPFDRRVPMALARVELPLDIERFERPLAACWEQLRGFLDLRDEERGG